jgi:mannose-6-phosphate isomerase-like protein (cupin superfamily)
MCSKIAKNYYATKVYYCKTMQTIKQVIFLEYFVLTNIIDWKQNLDSCIYDEKVGIRIAKLVGNNQFSTFITVIDAGKHVNPHYHKHGDEYYHIIEGNGEVKLKDVNSNVEEIHKVSSGSSFIVSENIIHQLVNTGSEPLTLMFSCPTAHLGIDRYFI